MSKPRYFEIDETITGPDWMRAQEATSDDPMHGIREVFPAAGPWQPISEAPKEGHPILLSDGDGQWYPGFWGTSMIPNNDGWRHAISLRIRNPSRFALVNPPPEESKLPEEKLRDVLHGMGRVADMMKEEREKINPPQEEHDANV